MQSCNSVWIKTCGFCESVGICKKYNHAKICGLLFSQNGRWNMDCTITLTALCLFTLFFVVSIQQQHSKIYLCHLAIPDNFHSFLPPLYQSYAISTRNLYEIHLWMVSHLISFPWRKLSLFLLHRWCTMNSKKAEVID